MDELLRQLGDLALGSVPTLILFIVLVLGYRFILYGSLMKTRAERRERTAGAMEKARLAIAQAEMRAQEYQARLRAARAEILHGREQRMQQWNAERDSAVSVVRATAQQRVRAAQAALETQTAEARRQIEGSAGQLSAQVLAAILPQGTAESAR